ncbi:MAG TPA: response regulator transcription factor [Burkholderiales bacterium]|nr:response regulator transcription factor [Burkholderiales bacterium]
MNQYEMTARAAFPTPSEPSPEALTARQREVLELLCEGLQNKQIARRLNIAAATVKIHVANILRALNVSSRLQAAVVAMSLGLIRRCGGAQPQKTDAPPRYPTMLRLVAADDIASGMAAARGDWSLEAAAG